MWKTLTHADIKRAMELARDIHAAQKYDEYPYFHHLEQVVDVLKKFNINDVEILIAGWLHDSLEDSSTSYSDLEKEFGTEVAEIVFCLTDELGRTRKEKKEKTYPKSRSNPKSIVVKLADRIANVEHSKERNSSQFYMYQKEQQEFEQHLRLYKHVDDMWNYLCKLLEL